MRRNVTLLLSVSPLFVSIKFVRAKEKKRWTASSGMRAVTLLALTISCLSSIPTFGQCGTTWVGPVSGVWSKSSDWSAGVPTASTNVCIDNGNPQHSAITLDIAGAQANNLTIDSDDSLSFVNAASLTVFGNTINNAGNITLNSVGNNTDLILAGNDTVTLTGGGKLNLGNSATNRVYSAGGGGTLINQETIQGAGQIGVGLMAIKNSGIIDANLSTALTISPNGAGVINTGTIEASSGGALVLVDSYNNAGGTIRAVTSPSTVELNTATISGGTLTTTGGGVMEVINSATLNGVTLSGGSTYTLPNATTTSLQGAITNNGTIQLNSGGNNTDLQISGAVSLVGTGTVSMGNNANNRIYSPGGTTLTNKQTIQGAGQLGVGLLTVNNQGVINANVSNALTISPNGGGVTNTGTIEASSGGTLVLVGSYNNAGGTIQAVTSPSTVELNGAAISGGTLTTTGGGLMEVVSTATLNGVTLSGGSTYTLPNATTTSLQGTITNNGTIQLNSGGNNTNLQVVGSVTLAGTGSVTLGSNAANRIYGPSGTDTLTNQQTIQGAGQIGVGQTNLVNQSLIDANTSVALTIQPNSNALVNTGTMEASNGATLQLTNGSFNNTNGTIEALNAASPSTVVLSSAAIAGGTLTTTGNGGIESGGSATLNTVTLSAGSNYVLPNATITALQGMITNNGTIQLNSGGNNTDLQISGAVTLTGTGMVNMGNNGANRIYAPNGTDTLTNKQTIQGAGQLGVGLTTLVNQGTIDAHFSGSQLLVQPNGGGLTNSGGILEATNGANLQLVGKFNNAAGTIEALSATTASTVTLAGATITGGTLTTTGQGLIESVVNGATLNGITLSTGSNYALPNSTITALQATITNNGTIQLNSGGNNTDLQISGPVTLAGTGTVTMGNNAANRIYAPNGTDTLTNKQTIQGAGQLGVGLLTLINQGIINANVSTPLVISANANGVTNTGKIEASSGGTLDLRGLYTNTGGLIESSTGSTTELDGATIEGGTLTSTGTGVMEVINSATLNGITVSTGTTASLLNATNAVLVGTITNNGTIKVNSGGNNTDLRISGPVTLAGTGSVTLVNNAANRIYALNGTDVLTNKETIQGAGQLGVGLMGLVNNGAIIANQSNALNVAVTSSGFTNNGTLQVNSGDLMHVSGGAFSNFSGSTLTGGSYVVSGTLEIDQLGSSGSEIVNDAAKITLSGPSSSFVDSAGKNVLANLATIAPVGGFTLSGSRNFTTAGNFINNGSLTVGAGSKFDVNGNLTNFSGSTLTGGTYAVSGTLQFDNANIVTNAANITLSGATSQIVNQTGANGLANFATNAAAGSFALAGSRNFTTAGNFTNNGTLTVGTGSKFDVNGNLTNFSGSTLTGGTYNVSGTLQFSNANIVTNAANITLTGTTSQIINQMAGNGLANFATNAAAGSFTLAGNRSLTTAGSLGDAGTVKISKGSTLTVGNKGNYMQSGGKTTIDGTLAATSPGTMLFNTGSVFGNGGTFTGNVTSSAMFNIGDVAKQAGTLAITGNYSQGSGGALNIDIGGTTAKTTYDQFNISGAASLGGALNLDLINSFTPTLGSTFDIMNFESETGTFATVTGTHINANEHFSVMVNPTNVTLHVLAGPMIPTSASSSLGASSTPEPGTFLLLGSGLLAMAYGVRPRWQK